jgi:hypothetical protein
MPVGGMFFGHDAGLGDVTASVSVNVGGAGSMGAGGGSVGCQSDGCGGVEVGGAAGGLEGASDNEVKGGVPTPTSSPPTVGLLFLG